MLTIIAVLALAIAAIGLLARQVPLTHQVVMFAAALSPYLMCTAVVSAILLFAERRWVLAIAATVVVAVSIAVELPLFMSDRQDPAVKTVPLRVMTANILYGRADAEPLVATANAHADVLAVQELTPEAVERLSAAGLDETFPYRALDARPGPDGVGMWSRFPITTSENIGGYQLAMVSARIKVEGVQVDPAVLVAHLLPPWPNPIADFRADMRRMQKTMRELAGSVGAGCAIVTGDFNSTPDMREFRHLLRNGFHDATLQAGAGFNRTYPADGRIPPIIAIDHVLTYQCTATSAETTELPGSDHRGLITTVEVPRSGTAS
ncbi:MAG TPA: endonuclease/exonuclease/phosphatase family protein [Mycobacterium sp.]